MTVENDRNHYSCDDGYAWSRELGGWDAETRAPMTRMVSRKSVALVARRPRQLSRWMRIKNSIRIRVGSSDLFCLFCMIVYNFLKGGLRAETLLYNKFIAKIHRIDSVRSLDDTNRIHDLLQFLISQGAPVNN